MAEQKKVTILIEKSKDVPSLPVTGAWGGVSPDGNSVIAHLYIEYSAVPNIIDVDVDQSGKINPNEGKRISRGDIVREVQTSLVLSPETAFNIGKWLMENGTKGLGIRKGRENQ